METQSQAEVEVTGAALAKLMGLPDGVVRFYQNQSGIKIYAMTGYFPWSSPMFDEWETQDQIGGIARNWQEAGIILARWTPVYLQPPF